MHMHSSDISVCKANTDNGVIKYAQLHTAWCLCSWRWWCFLDNSNGPKHRLCNQLCITLIQLCNDSTMQLLCIFTLMHSVNGQSGHTWWFTLSWGCHLVMVMAKVMITQCLCRCNGNCNGRRNGHTRWFIPHTVSGNIRHLFAPILPSLDGLPVERVGGVLGLVDEDHL